MDDESAAEKVIEAIFASIGAIHSVADAVTKLGAPSETVLGSPFAVAWMAQYTFASRQSFDIIIIEALDGSCEMVLCQSRIRARLNPRLAAQYNQQITRPRWPYCRSTSEGGILQYGRGRLDLK